MGMSAIRAHAASGIRGRLFDRRRLNDQHLRQSACVGTDKRRLSALAANRSVTFAKTCREKR